MDFAVNDERNVTLNGAKLVYMYICIHVNICL